MVLLTHLDKV